MSKALIPQEIHEIPAAIRETMKLTRASAKKAAAAIRARNPRRIYIMGNGTSYYSSLAASYTARSLAKPNDPLVIAVMAGDFLHFTPALNEQDVIIGVSASGEFRDVLTMFERVEGKCLRIGITHVPESSITKSADHILISAGGASRVPVMTKTYASTLTAIHLLLLEIFEAEESYFTDLEASANRVEDALTDIDDTLKTLAQEVSKFDHVFCFGAGNGFAAAQECALKLKEMALIHAEASETWEMASGPATMISEKTLCVALYTGSESDKETSKGAQHAQQWGAKVLELGPIAPVGDLHLPVPAPQNEAFASFGLVAAWGMLAFNVARLRGLNPDKPDWRDRYISQGMTHIIGE